MTVAELIEELRKHDGNMVVLTTNNFDEPCPFSIDVQEMYHTDKDDYEFARWGITDDEDDYRETPINDYTICKTLVIS